MESTKDILMHSILNHLPTGVPLLVLSGGFDSSLIAQLLVESNRVFDVVYVDYESTGPNKRIREKKAYETILAKYEHNIRNHIIQPIDGVSARADISLRYQQPWAHATAAAINTKIDTSCVLTGILLTDENKFDSTFAAAYQGAIQSFHPQYWSMGNQPKCITPLRNVEKAEVLEMVDLNLAQHLTFCESFGVDDNCGKCTPCKAFYGATMKKNMHTPTKVVLLRQSNRMDGLMRYLYALNELGDNLLIELGVNPNCKAWKDIADEHLSRQLPERPPEVHPGDVGLLGVADVILDRAPKDSALGEKSCTPQSV